MNSTFASTRTAIGSNLWLVSPRRRRDRREAAGGGDFTGVVLALAGLVLIGLALELAVESVRGRTAPAPL